ncbi:MAG: two-component system response regulator [Smithella sp.]
MVELTEEIKKDTILIVDDTPENIALITSLLKGIYRTKVATNGKKALQVVLSDDPPDLILLDIMMPEMDGYETCSQLKSNPQTADIPVIFLTAKTQVEDEQKGFELGAADYITKPISPPIVLSRVKTHLQLKKMCDFLRDKNDFLEREVARRIKEIDSVQDAAIIAIGSLAETRDNETGNHIRRTQHYMRLLAETLKDHPNFRHFLTDENIALLSKSAPLHDIGKVGIPDKILLKPGKHTPEESEIMKTHTTLGRDAIIAAEKMLNTPSSFLQFAREIAYTHHEKYDGTGHPRGLSGNSIPISGRLMALADVYDALISSRVYKEALPHEKAVSIIKEGTGTYFDADVVEAFLQVADQFKEISQKYVDGVESNKGGK